MKQKELETAPLTGGTAQPLFVIKKLRIGKLELDQPLIALFVMNFFLNAACSIISPFYPSLANGSLYKNNQLDLNDLQIGLVFSMHPVGGFLFGLFVAKFMEQIGRRTLMWTSLVTTVITLVALGLSFYLRGSPGAFFAVGIISRFFMGCARSGYGSTTFAYAPLLWPEKVPRVIGIMETATGMGLMLGPVIGSGLYEALGGAENVDGWSYQGVFYIISGVFALFIFPSIVMLPKDKPTGIQKKPLPLGKVLSAPKSFSLFMLLTGSLLTYIYILPVWANYLLNGYGVSNSTSALFTILGTIAYIFALSILPILLKKINRRVILSFGLLLGTFSCWILAPATAIGLPQKYPMSVAGLFLAGLAQGSCILPYIPEMIDLQLELFKDQPEFKSKVGDMASGLFMAAYSFGSFLGPTIGGIIQTFYGGDSNPLGKHTDTLYGYCANQKHLGRFTSGNFCVDMKPDPDDKLKVFDWCAEKSVQYNFEYDDSSDSQGQCCQFYSCLACRPFQMSSYIMGWVSLGFLILYLILGQGLAGWIALCLGKKNKQLQQKEQIQLGSNNGESAVHNQSSRSSEQGHITDALMTDSEYEQGNWKPKTGKASAYSSNENQYSTKRIVEEDDEDDDRKKAVDRETDRARSNRSSFVAV